MTNGVSQYTHRIRRTASVTRISPLFTGILFSILISSTMLFNATVLVAAEPLTLTDIQPPSAIEGDGYKWIIPVQGGMPPYRFSTTDELPLGLRLDSENGIIFGTPQTCINKASYSVTITVADRSTVGFWRRYAFKAMYKSNIKATGAQFVGETNLYVDGNPAGKLKSGQNVIQYLSCGDSHRISVDDNIVDPTDNTTRYTPTITSITVFCLSPNAEFIYNKEYLINVVIDPPEAGQYSQNPYEWARDPQWYKEGDIIKKDAPLEMGDKNNTKYGFDHWLLPTYEKIYTNNLNWQITRPGKVVACYKTYFLLDAGIPLMDIEGGGWIEKNTSAKWVIKNYAPRLTPGMGAFLGVYYIPYPDHGEEFMDKPKNLTIYWWPEFRPAIGSLAIALCITILGDYLYHKYRRKVDN